jgi:hypothetical protein
MASQGEKAPRPLDAPEETTVQKTAFKDATLRCRRTGRGSLQQPQLLVMPLRLGHAEDVIQTFGAHAVPHAMILGFIH